MGSNRRRKPSYNVPCNEDSGSEHSLSDGNPESELEGESSPVTRRPEKICNEAGNFSDPAESEAEGEEDQPASRDSPNGPSRGRKRSSSFLSSNSDPNVENISITRKKPRQRKLSQSEIEELQAKTAMLAAGFRAALERELLKKLGNHSNGSLSRPSAPSGTQLPKRIKIEDTESSSDALRREISVSDFYSQYFDDVRAFLLKRNYANPDVLASLEQSGFTKYELQSMRGFDRPALVTRFTSLLSDDCRKPAQLESLAFAVCAASSTE